MECHGLSLDMTSFDINIEIDPLLLRYHRNCGMNDGMNERIIQWRVYCIPDNTIVNGM